MVPRARVAVGIMLPLVFTSSNLAMRVASLLAGRFCFLCRSTRTFSPTCLQKERFEEWRHVLQGNILTFRLMLGTAMVKI